MKRAFRQPVVISLRKDAIYSRRGYRVFSPYIGNCTGERSDVSSLDESHNLLMEVDPELESLLELKRSILISE